MRNELSDAHKSDQIAMREADARGKVLENEISAMRSTIENLTEKADHLSVIVGENEKQLHELREERKLLQSSVDFEVAERIRFSKLHDEVVTSMQSQRRALSSATDELDKARDRVMKLEARQSELLGEREELQASLQTAETLRETDAKNYEIRLEALTSRARLAEHLLEKARDEQRSNFRDQTAQAETQRHMRRLESEVEALKQELQDTARRNKELEKSETQLQARVEELSIQLRGHVRSSEQSSEKIRMQQEVIEALHKRHAEYLQQVEDQSRKLNEQLENERADRTYLEARSTPPAASATSCRASSSRSRASRKNSRPASRSTSSQMRRKANSTRTAHRAAAPRSRSFARAIVRVRWTHRATANKR